MFGQFKSVWLHGVLTDVFHDFPQTFHDDARIEIGHNHIFSIQNSLTIHEHLFNSI